MLLRSISCVPYIAIFNRRIKKHDAQRYERRQCTSNNQNLKRYKRENKQKEEGKQRQRELEGRLACLMATGTGIIPGQGGLFVKLTLILDMWLLYLYGTSSCRQETVFQSHGCRREQYGGVQTLTLRTKAMCYQFDLRSERATAKS